MKYLPFFCLLLLIPAFGFSQSVLASHEFEAQDVSSVFIEGRFCNVNIKYGTMVVFKGRIEGNGNPEDYDITSELRGSDLYIEARKRTRGWDRISDAYMELTVPNEVTVFIETTSGDIRAIDLKGESFDFEATSGNIELYGIGGRIDAKSTSGNLEMRNINGQVYGKSTSGNHDYENIEGNLEAISSSGDIELSQYSGEIRAESTSGGIELERGTGALYLKSTSGDIEGYQLQVSGDSQFRASSGDIDIEMNNNLEEFSFDLQTSSGSLRVGSRTAEKNLYLRQGGFWIRGVTSSGDIRFSN